MKKNFVFRNANENDLPAIIDLLKEDPLGHLRENSLNFTAYQNAFKAIQNDPHHHVLILESEEELVGCVQISFIPNLTFQGSWRAQLEGVRIKLPYQKKGLGTKLLTEAIRQAEQFGCTIVQLTTHHSRPEAIAFYKKLGFENTHIGMKLLI